MYQEASNVHLTKMRSVLLIRCLLKMPPSSSTSTSSQIATWRRSLTWTTSRIRLRSSTTVDEKDVRPTTVVSYLNSVQRDILPHHHSQLSDLTTSLYTTSVKSISLKRWLYRAWNSLTVRSILTVIKRLLTVINSEIDRDDFFVYFEVKKTPI